MYAYAVILIMIVMPAISILAEAMMPGASTDIVWLTGKWVVFWSLGVRLFIAGIVQILKPTETLSIFGTDSPAAYGLVREIGMGNIGMGALALLSLFFPAWVVPAAIPGGVYLGLAGIGHAVRQNRNAKEQMAMATDFIIVVVLVIFLVLHGF